MLYRCTEWHRLVGARVEVRRNGTAIRVATISEAMPDGSAVWLSAEGVEARMFIDAYSGYEICVEDRVFFSLV